MDDATISSVGFELGLLVGSRFFVAVGAFVGWEVVGCDTNLTTGCSDGYVDG